MRGFESENLRSADWMLDSIPYRIDDQMNEKLTREVTENEVYKAVFQLGRSRAPGPPSFIGLFYQQNWNIAGPYVFTAVSAFLKRGTFPPFLNQTDRTLIQKYRTLPIHLNSDL